MSKEKVTKEKLVDFIYNGLNKDFRKDNIFETPESQRYWKRLTDEIPHRLKGLDTRAVSDYSDALSEILSLERRAAFTIGFNSAIELIMESLNLPEQEENDGNE